MKRVFEYIALKSAQFADEPLLIYLRDPTVAPDRKLKLVPWAAHFVMTYADLCHFFLRIERPRDRYDDLINIHISEEATHWKWFLADLTNLGMDPTVRFTDAIRLLWSDATAKTRNLSYEICKLSAALGSLQRLVMVNAIEATGAVTIEALTRVGTEFEARSGRRLVFFGSHHLESERDHTIADDAIRVSLEELSLDDETRADLFSIVDRVFEHFRGFADDSLRMAQAGLDITDGLDPPKVASTSGAR